MVLITHNVLSDRWLICGGEQVCKYLSMDCIEQTQHRCAGRNVARRHLNSTADCVCSSRLQVRGKRSTMEGPFHVDQPQWSLPAVQSVVAVSSYRVASDLFYVWICRCRRSLCRLQHCCRRYLQTRLVYGVASRSCFLTTSAILCSRLTALWRYINFVLLLLLLLLERLSNAGAG